MVHFASVDANGGCIAIAGHEVAHNFADLEDMAKLARTSTDILEEGLVRGIERG